jgi:putative flippase GtrA
MKLKYSAVSLVATASDFTVSSLIVATNITYNFISTFLGMIVGAIVSWFLLNNWAFSHSQVAVEQRRFRFLLGVLLCIFLNVSLMAICTDYLSFPFFMSRVVIAVLVWIVIFWFNSKLVFKV